MDQLELGQGMPEICIPIVEKRETEILEFAAKLRNSVADLVEWRVDYFEQMTDISAVQKLCVELKKTLGEKPILFTIRTTAEGGEAEISSTEYAEILKSVAALPEVSYIDVEVYSGSRGQDEDAWEDTESPCHDRIKELIKELRKEVCVIGSYHDFTQTPSQEEIYKRLLGSYHLGADVPKLAVMPHSREDVMVLMNATMQVKEELDSIPLITMSMGDLGKVSRVAGESFGSAVTFGCIGKTSAPGQIEAGRLKEVLQLLHVENVYNL